MEALMWRFDPSERQFLRETDEALMNAPFVEGGWMTALDMIARATSSRGANLVCLGGALPSLNLISGFDQDLVDRYFANPEMWGRHNWRVGTATGPFEIQHDALSPEIIDPGLDCFQLHDVCFPVREI